MGPNMHPGSLTVSTDTFVRLYLDILHSLSDNGLRRVFLVSGHLGGRHLKAMARIAKEAAGKIDGMKVYALIDSERVEQLGLRPSASVVPIERGLNFQMLTQLLGRGTEAAASTHADGWEISLMLHYLRRWYGPDTNNSLRRRPQLFSRQSPPATQPRIRVAWAGFPSPRLPRPLAKQLRSIVLAASGTPSS